jgi:predicted PurR-regulated permease PerM
MRRPDPAVLRLIVFFGSLAAVITLLIVFRGIFQPLLLGLGIAYLFDPLVSWFERRGRSRTLGVIVLATGLIVALVATLLFVIPTIGEQFDNLAEKLPRYQLRIRELVKPLFDRLEARYPDEVGELQQRLVDGLRENLPKVAGSLGNRLRSLFSNLLDVVLFLLNLVFVPVFAFYLLVDWPKLKKGLVGLIPVPYRAVTLERVTEVDGAVASFLRGQLTIALILAAINATGLVALGVPFGLALGLIAGLANMIPYMALVVGLLPAVLLCWAEHQSWPLVLGVVAVFSGAQLLEGTVLSPRILSKSVNLHPVWVLLAIIAGGSLFGFVGLLIAVPAAAAIQVFARHWLELYRASRIFGSEPVEIEDGGSQSLEEASGETSS